MSAEIFITAHGFDVIDLVFPARSLSKEWKSAFTVIHYHENNSLKGYLDGKCAFFTLIIILCEKLLNEA